MLSQKLYTVNKLNIASGIDLSIFQAASTTSDKVVDLGFIASYPLYPKLVFSIKALSMVPLSLSFVLPASLNNYKISTQGIILQIDASLWLPLDSKTDNSILLDISDNKVLLYCPACQTFLRNTDKKHPKLLTINLKCKPLITLQTRAQLDMISLGEGFVTPDFNSEAAEFLDRKMRGKGKSKRLACVPKEESLSAPPLTSKRSGKLQKLEEE